MTHSYVRSAALAVVAIVVLGGCGGGAPNTSDPAGSVTAALTAVESGGYAKLADYTCAAKKGNIATLFGGAGLGSLATLGIDANTMFDAMKVDFQEVKTTESNKTGDTATVHVAGKAAMTFDAAKMKEIFKKVMAAQGLPVDDTTIDATVTAMTSSLGQAVPIDEDLTLKQEGGAWLIC